jgi:hypothetical protein
MKFRAFICFVAFLFCSSLLFGEGRAAVSADSKGPTLNPAAAAQKKNKKEAAGKKKKNTGTAKTTGKAKGKGAMIPPVKSEKSNAGADMFKAESAARQDIQIESSVNTGGLFDNSTDTTRGPIDTNVTINDPVVIDVPAPVPADNNQPKTDGGEKAKDQTGGGGQAAEPNKDTGGGKQADDGSKKTDGDNKTGNEGNKDSNGGDNGKTGNENVGK